MSGPRIRPAVVLFLALVAAVPAAGAQNRGETPTGGITVGEFARQVASLALPDPLDREKLTGEDALASLRRSGLSLPGPAARSITEGDVVEFFLQAGLRLEGGSVDRPLTAAKAGALLSNFGSYFAAHAADPARDAVLLAARGGSRPPVPDDFSECAVLEKVPDCRACCVAMGGTLRSCGRACGQARAGKFVSPSEPTP